MQFESSSHSLACESFVVLLYYSPGISGDVSADLGPACVYNKVTFCDFQVSKRCVYPEGSHLNRYFASNIAFFQRFISASCRKKSDSDTTLGYINWAI